MKNRNRWHIYFANQDWNDGWKARQSIANEIAKSGELVLYIESFVSVFTAIRHSKYRPKIIQWLKGKRHGLRRQNKNLIIFTPSFGFHLGSHLPLLLKINYALLRIFIKKVMSDLQIKNPIFWFSDVFAGYLLGRLGEQMSICYMLDEPKEFYGAHKQNISKAERDILPKVDLIFVVSEQLLKSKRELNANTFLIRNGVNVDRFFKTEKNREIDILFKGIRRPILGFVGAVATWVNLDLLKYVAESLPQNHLVLVGPELHGNPTEANALRKLKNVFFLGQRQQKDIPCYIQNFDVCLIPFIRNKLTKNADPLKLYEYLAAGKTVVATNISDYYGKLNEYIYLAQDKREFVGVIKRALSENSDDKRAKRIQFAKECSWQNRWNTMRNIIKSYVGEKSCKTR